MMRIQCSRDSIRVPTRLAKAFRPYSTGMMLARWTVLDGTGEVVGVVTLPRRQVVVAVRGAVMVAVEEDELGRVTLVRYRGR